MNDVKTCKLNDFIQENKSSSYRGELRIFDDIFQITDDFTAAEKILHGSLSVSYTIIKPKYCDLSTRFIFRNVSHNLQNLKDSIIEAAK